MLKVKISETWNDGDEVRDCGMVLQVWHNGECILEEADTMEPEDVTYGRDLSWIPGIIEKAYALGGQDKLKEAFHPGAN